MIGVELFAGAGGLSQGAEQAGIKVGYAIELSKPAAETFCANHPAATVMNTDVRGVSGADLDLGSNEVFLFGGPPCQGFSTSNQKNRNKENSNNWLFEEFLRLVREISPSVVLFENVAGITHTEGGYFEKRLRSGLNDMGYHVSAVLADASLLGVPQKRTRFFCVGSKLGAVSFDELYNTGSSVTVGDAILDLPPLDVGSSSDFLPYAAPPPSEYASRLRRDLKECSGHLVTKNAPHIVARYSHVPQGGNWSDIPGSLMTTYKDASRCHTGIYRRLKLDEPSVVLGNYRKNMLIHPVENRGLSVREAARLQSFPDTYRFFGSIGQQQQQVGNAVPPIMAEQVFKCVLDQIGGGFCR